MVFMPLLEVNNLRFMDNMLVSRLREFIENETRSCSMDFGCITPLYVYRMWGGAVALEDICAGLREMKLPTR